jgi:hypothetical protein
VRGDGLTYRRLYLQRGMEKQQRWEKMVTSSVVESDPDPPGSAFHLAVLDPDPN